MDLKQYLLTVNRGETRCPDGCGVGIKLSTRCTMKSRHYVDRTYNYVVTEKSQIRTGNTQNSRNFSTFTGMASIWNDDFIYAMNSLHRSSCCLAEPVCPTRCIRSWTGHSSSSRSTELTRVDVTWRTSSARCCSEAVADREKTITN